MPFGAPSAPHGSCDKPWAPTRDSSSPEHRERLSRASPGAAAIPGIPGSHGGEGTQHGAAGLGSGSTRTPSSGRAFPSLQTPGLPRHPARGWRRWKWEDGDEVEWEGGCGCSQGGQGRGTQPNQAAATEGTEQSRAGSLRAVRVRQAFQESLGGPEGRNREVTAWKRPPGAWAEPAGCRRAAGHGLARSQPPTKPGSCSVSGLAAPSPPSPDSLGNSHTPPPRHGPGPLPITVASGQGAGSPWQLAVGGSKPPRTTT